MMTLMRIPFSLKSIPTSGKKFGEKSMLQTKTTRTLLLFYGIKKYNMNAFVFPGQGSQFQGMGKDLADQHQQAADLFAKANDILGFSLTDVMFSGSAEDLRQTRVTQPAIFVHFHGDSNRIRGMAFSPQMVAGHSLGEFSALTATGTLTFADGLRLVAQRAQAMQDACNQSQGTMAAVLALADEVVEDVCANTKGIVVAANYNCPGQLVISGEVPAVEAALRTTQRKRSQTRIAPPCWGCFSFPADGTRTGTASRCDSSNFICQAHLPNLSKRNGATDARHRSHQRKSHRSAHWPSQMDTNHSSNA
jgi:[acyl-carrier-protein] S-malonyltransferase